MELMRVRRRILMQQTPSIFDTSPKIAVSGYRYSNGNPATNPPIASNGDGLTEFYSYPAQTYKQTIHGHGLTSTFVVYDGDKYIDYWSASTIGETGRTVVNIGSNRMSFTIRLNLIDDSFAYLEETGQILFAGKNSIYYGYKNINDIPEQEV